MHKQQKTPTNRVHDAYAYIQIGKHSTPIANNLSILSVCIQVAKMSIRRQQQGELIAQTKGSIKRFDDMHYVVSSQSGNAFYNVQLTNDSLNDYEEQRLEEKIPQSQYVIFPPKFGGSMCLLCTSITASFVYITFQKLFKDIICSSVTP